MATARDPLVLVHGYMDTTDSPWWSRLKSCLLEVGYDDDRIHRIDFGSTPGVAVGSPRRYGRQVEDRLQAVAESQGSVDVLAHSMGGLCVRWAIERLDGAQFVDDLVTLGTPHQGSYLAYLGWGTAGGRAMVPDSPFLSTLNGDPLPPGVDYTAVWSTDDEAIRPVDHATLPLDLFPSMDAARNVRVEDVSHMDLMSDPDVLAHVLERLG